MKRYWFLLLSMAVVAAPPEVELLFPTCDTSYFVGSPISLIAFSQEPNVSYSWELSNGQSITGNPAQVVVSDVGPVTIRMIATNGQGEQAEPVEVLVFFTNPFEDASKPTVTRIESSAAAVRPGGSVTFSASISDPEADGPYTHYWCWKEDGVFKRSSEEQPRIQFSLPEGEDETTYTVFLFVTDQGNHASTITNTSIFVSNRNLPPNGRIVTPSSATIDVVAGSVVTFIAEGDDPEGNLPLTYEWIFPDGSIGRDNPANYRFDQVGITSVSMLATDSLGNRDPQPATVIVNVIESPMATETVIRLPSQSTRLFVGDSLILAGIVSGVNQTLEGTWELVDVLTDEVVTRVEGNQPGRMFLNQPGLFRLYYYVEQFGQRSPPDFTNIRFISVNTRDDNRPPILASDDDPILYVKRGDPLTLSVNPRDPDGDAVNLFWAINNVLQSGGGTQRTFRFDPPEDAFAGGFATQTVTTLAIDARGKSPNLPFTRTIFTYQDRIPPQPKINDLGVGEIVFVPLGSSFNLGSSVAHGDGLDLNYTWSGYYLGDFSAPAFSSNATQPGSFTPPKTGIMTLSLNVETSDGSLRNALAATVWLYVYDPNQLPNATITKPNVPVVRVESNQSVTFEGFVEDANRFAPPADVFSFLTLASPMIWEIEGPNGFFDSVSQDFPLSYQFPNEGNYTVRLKTTNQLDLSDPSPDSVQVQVVGRQPDSAFEPNDSRATAALLTIGNYGGLSVGPGDPIDWYRFQLEQAGSAIDLVFDLSESNEPARLEFFREDSLVLSSELKAGLRQPFTFVGGQAGTYFLRLTSTNSAAGKKALSFGFSVAVSNPRLTFSYPKSDAVDETYITLVNPLGSEAQTTLVARDSSGKVLGEVGVKVAGRGQCERSIRELFPSVEALEIAWVQVRSDRNVIGMSTTMGRDGETALAEPAVIGSVDSLVIPHIAQNTGLWYTRAALVNTSGERIGAEFQAPSGRFDLDGFESIHQRSLIDFEQFFDGRLPDGTVWGSFVETNALPGLNGMELFGTKIGSPRLAGLNLTGVNLKNPNFVFQNNDIYFPHVAKDRVNFWTGIAFVNTSETPVDVLLLAYDDQGQVQAQQPITMEPRGKRVGLAEDLFEQLPASAEISWIQLKTSGPIQGYALFGDNDGDDTLLAGLPAVNGGSKEVYFQKILHEPGTLFTGIAVVNLSESATANLTYEAYSGEGKLLATANRSIGSYRKDVALVEAIFGGTLPPGTKWVRLVSSEPVAAFELFGDLDRRYLAGANAQ